MSDWVNTLLPIFTLLLGAGWGNLLKRGELRNAMRLEAADQLAELPARLWTKGGADDWVKMTTAVDRLTMRLGLAGVPASMTAELAAAAKGFWGDVHEIEGVPGEPGPIWAVSGGPSSRWDKISASVAELLSSGSAVRRWRIRRDAKRTLGS